MSHHGDLIPPPYCPQRQQELSPGDQQTPERQNHPDHHPDDVVHATRLHAAERRRWNDVETSTADKAVTLDCVVPQEQRQGDHRRQAEHCQVEEERPVKADRQQAGVDWPTHCHVALGGYDGNDPRAAQQENVVKRSTIQLVVEAEAGEGDVVSRCRGDRTSWEEQLRKSNCAEQEVRSDERDEASTR